MTPTGKPTLNPSQKPTDLPSNNPSKFPSDTPTGKPSNIPSDLPTHFPSQLPSDLPTLIPSIFPTNKPTGPPTPYPTENMVDRPSSTPSFTFMPTYSPTLYPTKHPSILPSNYPSTLPSYTPLEISTISATPFEVNLSPLTFLLSSQSLKKFNDACDRLLEREISQTSLDSSASITFATIVLDQILYSSVTPNRRLINDVDVPRLGLRLKKVISVESKPLEDEDVYMPSVAMLDGFIKKTFDSQENVRNILNELREDDEDTLGFVNTIDFTGFLQIEGMPNMRENNLGIFSGFSGEDVDQTALIISCVAGALVLLLVAAILIVRARTATDDQSFHEYLQYNSASGSGEDLDLQPSPRSTTSRSMPSTSRGGGGSSRGSRMASKHGSPTKGSRRYIMSSSSNRSPVSSKSPRTRSVKTHSSSKTSPRKNKRNSHILRMPSGFGKQSQDNNTPHDQMSVSYTESDLGDDGVNVDITETIDDDLPEVLLEEAAMRGAAVGKTSRPEAYHEISMSRTTSGNSKKLHVNDSLISEVTLGSLEPVNKSMLSGDMKKTWEDWKQYIARPLTPTKNAFHEKTRSASSRIPRSRSVGARETGFRERSGAVSASPYRIPQRRSFAGRGGKDGTHQSEARDLYMQQSASVDYGGDFYNDDGEYYGRKLQHRGTYSYDDIDEMQFRRDRSRKHRRAYNNSAAQHDFAELPGKFLDTGTNLVMNMLGPRREKFIDGSIR
mmetsp:Transcript_5098/g.10287  ORF Transcript_5098/g.10287 Transcript_5098/m.10287 type:complete len:726 (-) Transcript_5098:149-2326(-)